MFPSSSPGPRRSGALWVRKGPRIPLCVTPGAPKPSDVAPIIPTRTPITASGQRPTKSPARATTGLLRGCTPPTYEPGS